MLLRRIDGHIHLEESEEELPPYMIGRQDRENIVRAKITDAKILNEYNSYTDDMIVKCLIEFKELYDNTDISDSNNDIICHTIPFILIEEYDSDVIIDLCKSDIITKIEIQGVYESAVLRVPLGYEYKNLEIPFQDSICTFPIFYVGQFIKNSIRITGRKGIIRFIYYCHYVFNAKMEINQKHCFNYMNQWYRYYNYGLQHIISVHPISAFEYMDLLTFDSTVIKCENCNNIASYYSYIVTNKFFCDNCYDCKKAYILLPWSRCIKCYQEDCSSCSISIEEINKLVFYKINSESIYTRLGWCLFDVSPRHQDISHLPLELLEKIDKHSDWVTAFDSYNKESSYKTFHMYKRPLLDLGSIRNWFVFFRANNETTFIVNIKDMRVACCCIDYIIPAFNTYQEYLEAYEKNSLSDYFEKVNIKKYL